VLICYNNQTMEASDREDRRVNDTINPEEEM
jgi:hypothetical protein